MAKRDKKSKLRDLVVLVGAGAVVYLVVRYGGHVVLPTYRWLLVGLGVLMLWVSFAMPTYCDYRTLHGRGCTRWIRGKLRGCRTHSRLKRDALWAAVRLVNPGRVVRTTWEAPPESASRYPAAQPVHPQPPTQQGKRDAVIFGCTVLSGVTGLVSAVAGVAAVV